ERAAAIATYSVLPTKRTSPRRRSGAGRSQRKRSASCSTSRNLNVWCRQSRARSQGSGTGAPSVAQLGVMESRRPRGGGLLALGRKLAVEGLLARVSVALGAFIVVGSVVWAIAVARGAHCEGLSSVPLVASSALAWGAGTLLAFAASV